MGRFPQPWSTLLPEPCFLAFCEPAENKPCRAGTFWLPWGPDAACGCRELGKAVSTVSADQVRAVELRDFGEALQSIRPSVNQEQLHRFDQWTQEYGTHS